MIGSKGEERHNVISKHLNKSLFVHANVLDIKKTKVWI